MTASFETERDDADLAAEYALGVLDGAERRSVERRTMHDATFAREVEDWQARLGPMANAVPATEPPRAVWARISSDLDRMTRRSVSSERSAESAGRGRTGRTVSAVWQWLGIGGMGLAVASLAALLVLGPGHRALVGGPGSPVSGATLTATLASATGTPLFTVVIDRATSTATLIPVSSEPTDGRVPELWLLPPAGAAPKSLGLLDMNKPLRLVLKERGLSAGNTALAVSMEPEGGSPTGAPTGPVVASGPLSQI